MPVLAEFRCRRTISASISAVDPFAWRTTSRRARGQLARQPLRALIGGLVEAPGLAVASRRHQRRGRRAPGFEHLDGIVEPAERVTAMGTPRQGLRLGLPRPARSRPAPYRPPLPKIVPGPLRWSELDPGGSGLPEILLESAIAFHVVHVVPGGEPEPSAAEVDFCRRLVATAKVVGVWMVEYVIYAGEGRWRSLYQCPVWDGGAVVGDEVLAAADPAARGVEAPEGARDKRSAGGFSRPPRIGTRGGRSPTLPHPG